jgi:hypothetical protein
MKRTIVFLTLMLTNMACNAQLTEKKEVEKNNMNVSWHFENGRIYFEMTAPTDRWVTIGFNTKSAMDGAYLLMGNVINGKADLVEHYTTRSGNYAPITKHEAKPRVEDVGGNENSNSTTIRFSLPTKAFIKYQRELSEGKEYVMIIAYSQEDDFQYYGHV